MADDSDSSDLKEAVLVDAAVRQVQQRASDIPKGEPGECDACGEYFERVVNHMCGRCRDKEFEYRRRSGR